MVFGLKRFFTKLLGGKAKRAARPDEAEAVRIAFTNRYLNFRTLLSTNNKVLEIITEMEQALSSSRSFGMSFVRASCTAISVNMYKIVQSLNEITSQRYTELFHVFEGIWSNIDQEIKSKKAALTGEMVLPIGAIDMQMADQVGSKMANLGEVRNQVGLPVPEGFAITASAYERFFEHSNLQDEINRRIQSLEPDDIARLHETSSAIQKAIINANIPPEIEAAIFSAHADLKSRIGENARVSMRSSAIGEDGKDASFAGQYRSLLNVGADYLSLSYKEILASKYSVPAMAYRLNKGFRDEDILMCVGCMAMIQARSGGVMYSADPAGNQHSVLINAVWGLGKPVVDGSLTPDVFLVSKKDLKIIKKVINPKEHKFVCDPEEGVCRTELLGEERNQPALSESQAVSLAEMAVRLEDYFGCAQDIEWAIENDGSIRVLQSRPLMVLGRELADSTDRSEDEAGLKVALAGGVTGSPGVACGPAFLVETMVDILQFPRGAVLVAKNPLPQWAAVLNMAAAVLTDHGGATGHLAAVAREFKVPALLGAANATSAIRNSDLITVDADRHKVYFGESESILAGASGKDSIMKGSPVYTTLANVLKYIAPLNLTDPDAPNFSPDACRTIHDITRFAHEMSLRELFEYDEEIPFSKQLAKRLVVNVPMAWWIIDLGGGFKAGVQGDTIRLEDITSIPMLVLWEGITALPWQGPPAMDTKGFLSILYQSTMDTCLEPGMHSRFAERNYFIISDKFCHLSSRFGFHFSTVESFLSDRTAENYVCFNFKGGAADSVRKGRRAKLIKALLERFGFWVQIKNDLIFARLERRDQEYLKERLRVLGHLSIHTRQLDMVLSDSARVNMYVEEMSKQISSSLGISR
ncbi:MAG: PEP/pyruvate-binding domain-containing protein [Pseudomonadota bacterium]